MQIFHREDEGSRVFAFAVCFNQGDKNGFIEDIVSGITEATKIDLMDAFDDYDTIEEWY